MAHALDCCAVEWRVTPMRRLLFLVGAGLLVATFSGPVAAAERTEHCAGLESFSSSAAPSPSLSLDDLDLAAGERIRIEFTPWDVPASAWLALTHTGTGVFEFVAGSAPGPLEVTVPATGRYDLDFHADALVLLTVTCDAAPDTDTDTDGDGILDAVDLCADTVLPDVFPKYDAKRYKADTAGELTARKSPTYTLADTGGCSATQIINAMNLGSGHLKYGLSRSALEQWIASVGS
ncbi:MAG: hypothetical protein K5924_07715 [Chloroflexi bacterium]|nr:hypothetical protein [Chloroflexota bacterium]